MIYLVVFCLAADLLLLSWLFVGLLPSRHRLPSVVNMSQDEARAALRKAVSK